MAQIKAGFTNAVMLGFLLAALSSMVATVSAQASEPSPSPDAGAAFSLPVSGAVVASSLVLSALAVFRH